MHYEYVSKSDGKLYIVKDQWSEAQGDYNIVDDAGDLAYWQILSCIPHKEKVYRLYIRQRSPGGNYFFRIVFCPQHIVDEINPFSQVKP